MSSDGHLCLSWRFLRLVRFISGLILLLEFLDLLVGLFKEFGGVGFVLSLLLGLLVGLHPLVEHSLGNGVRAWHAACILILVEHFATASEDCEVETVGVLFG